MTTTPRPGAVRTVSSGRAALARAASVRATLGWAALVVIVVAVRAASLDAYPLADTTEARYAEIARLMAESGDWITPRIEPDTPFLAKPPLSSWLAALSLRAFGVSERAARLPSLACLLAVAALAASRARRRGGTVAGGVAATIVLSSLVGFIAAGAVMTDPALVLATTLAAVAAAAALGVGDEASAAMPGAQVRGAAYLFFVALGLGLLAKGPVAVVLIGLPIALWASVTRRWRLVLARLPPLEGTAVIALVALPWYLLAESRTPGFIEYFVLGENVQRFLESGWQGDRFGVAHAEPRGMIWPLGLAAFAPWSFALPLAWLLARARGVRAAPIPALPSEERRWWWCWLLAPFLFFSLAGNILATYVLPALPALAILAAPRIATSPHAWRWLAVAAIVPAIVALAAPLGLIERLEARSQAGLLEAAAARAPGSTIAYAIARPHSARFYSRGTARLLPDEAAVAAFAADPGEHLVARARDVERWQPDTRGRLFPIAASGTYRLFETRGVAGVSARPDRHAYPLQ